MENEVLKEENKIKKSNMKKILLALILSMSAVATMCLTSCSPNVDENDDCVVYVTRNGTHYHSSKQCAGKNSYAISCSKIGNRKPCKKCM